MRLQRWCFDVELIYLAQQLRIPVTEVSVNWTEIPGMLLSRSPCNVVRSLSRTHLPRTFASVTPAVPCLPCSRDDVSPYVYVADAYCVVIEWQARRSKRRASSTWPGSCSSSWQRTGCLESGLLGRQSKSSKQPGDESLERYLLSSMAAADSASSGGPTLPRMSLKHQRLQWLLNVS